MDKGIIAGCDHAQEYLLPWWWENYTLYNDYPVAFADFGMSEKGRAFCREKGQCFLVQEMPINRKPTLPQTRVLWQEHYGEGIWTAREIWLRKPFAMLSSPFPSSIWLDLDCEVRGDLKPIFQLLQNGVTLALRREKEAVQKTQREKGFIGPDEINYNAGVVLFQKNGRLLKQWVAEILASSELHVFEQQALAKVLKEDASSFLELPSIYNWSMENGVNLDALIYHYHGSYLKRLIPRV